MKFNPIFTVVAFMGVVIVMTAIIALMRTAPSNTEPVSATITTFCDTGGVYRWREDATGQILYELRKPVDLPGFGGTYTFYTAAGEEVGVAEWTDTDSLILNDGSRAFCSYNGAPCPSYVGEFCGLTH